MTTTDQRTDPRTDPQTDQATAPPAIDMDTLMAFVGAFVGDLGATVGAGNVLLGERLGLYRSLAQGPADARTLAAATGTDPRYVDEWLRGQAAGGYVEHDAATGTYSMTPEKAFALTDPDGPVFLPGAFELALGALKALPEIEHAFRTGAGYGWHEHDQDVFTGCERFFRPGYLMHLLPEWIPALDGVAGRLERGARVADLGCGHGASTILMAQAFPASTFVGSDYHQGSIEAARDARGRRRGVGTGCASTSPARSRWTSATSTWSRRSTACTTWATRSARPSTSAARWPPTARG